MNKAVGNIILVRPVASCVNSPAGLAKDLPEYFKKFRCFLDLKLCNVSLEANGTGENHNSGYFLNPQNRQDYFQLAETFNNDAEVKAVIVFFQPGYYSGEMGEDILFLLYSLEKPSIVCFNHIEKNGNRQYCQLLKNLCNASGMVVTFNQADHDELKEINPVQQAKLRFINKDLPLCYIQTDLDPEQERAICLDYISLELAKFINESVSGPGLLFSHPEIFPEIFRKVENRKFHPEFIPENQTYKWLDYSAQVTECLMLYNSFAGEPYNKKLLEIYVDQVCEGVLKISDKIALGSKLTVQEEQAAGKAFTVLSEFLIYTSKNSFPGFLTIKARESLKYIQAFIGRFKSVTALSYVIKGLYVSWKNERKKEILQGLEKISETLLQAYYDDVQSEKINPSLHCPEISAAFLYAFLGSQKEIYKVLAIITLDNLISEKFSNSKGMGNSENLKDVDFSKIKFMGSTSSEACEVITVLQIFYSVFQDKLYIEYLQVALSWFAGHNDTGIPVSFPNANFCFDGIKNNGMVSPSSELAGLHFLKSLISAKTNGGKSQKAGKRNPTIWKRILAG